MLESVLAQVLNRTLSAYVDDFSTNQLNVGIWSGDVKLKHLRLKPDALAKFNLPLHVIEGYLGDLTLSIPWSVQHLRPCARSSGPELTVPGRISKGNPSES